MRIVVSGSHCSGKSTLIEDFVAAHPEYVHEPEPNPRVSIFGRR